MEVPISRSYQFSQLLSDNDLCQSWLAYDTRTSRPCFVKTPSQNDRLDLATRTSILSYSYECQKWIRSTCVVRAVRKRIENERLYIEYPYAEPTKWQVLTPDLFLKNYRSALVQLCLITDYLHDLGLVHCDLKLSNFLIETESEKPALRLVDLDFLCPAGSPMRARILGTPGHIASEIMANERAIAQSDNYSLGASLQDYLDRAPNGLAAVDQIEGLRQLSARLSQTDFLNRPRYLLEALRKAELIAEADFEKSQKSLLAMVLLSRFLRSDHNTFLTESAMAKFLQADNRILGIHVDLFDALARAFGRNRFETFQVFRAFIAGALLARKGDYWHIQAFDNVLYDLYRSLDSVPPRHLVSDTKRPAQEPFEQDEELKLAAEYKDAQRYQRAFLMFQHVYSRMEASPEAFGLPSRQKILRSLFELSQWLNRLEDAGKYGNLLLEATLNDQSARARLIQEILLSTSRMGRLADMARLQAIGLEAAQASGDTEMILAFERYKAWLLMSENRYAEAEEILESVTVRSQESAFHAEEMRNLGTKGVLCWRRGQHSEARKFCDASIEVARRHDLLAEAAPQLCVLEMLCLEDADYVSAMKFGKLALRLSRDAVSVSLLPSIYGGIVAAYIRMADFRKAEFWLQRLVALGTPGDFHFHLFWCYQMEAFLRLNRSDLQGLLESSGSALSLSEANEGSKFLARVHQNLAETALQQGKLELCRHHLELARPIYAAMEDLASLAELDMIETLAEHYYGQRDRSAELVSIFKKIKTYHASYYAAVCLFHILLLPGTSREQSDDYIEGMAETLRQPNVPVFRAIRALSEDIFEKETPRFQLVHKLKRAFSFLLAGEQRFLALLVSLRMARSYASDGQTRHAHRFYEQSLKLSEALGNQSLISIITRETEWLTDPVDRQRWLINSFHAVSVMLKGIGDFSESLHELVQFAVDQTGAERGVLLLQSDEKSRLRVAAAVDCDDHSLEDIIDFSSTVPRTTLADLEPLFIENAVEDRRTNRYRSVVVHNILSVAAVPLVHGDETLGVLYLDHHTIPALFEPSDVAYITAIANVISVLLATGQAFRRLHLANAALMEDVNRLGQKDAFITRDGAMLRLFEKLPQVAQSVAPILIRGESGTGKEILCHRIHALSPRAKQPLLKLNCAAIAATMIESELFGVAKNAATGVAERDGKFAAADGGTLFLDEIGDMPLEVQAKVLRVLEYQQFERVGSNRVVHTDVRFIYATNKDLLELVKLGRFRHDLFYRISTITIEIPPLRERPTDIWLLIEHFMRLFAVEGNRPRFSTDAQTAISAYQWPGNVRELRNFIERCCILYPNAQVSIGMLPVEMQRISVSAGQSALRRDISEAARIREALEACDWNQSRAARQLGLPLSTLRRKMKKYNIIKPD